MLNLASVEGFITRRRWRRNGYHFFRLAVFRDQDRPRKHLPEGEGRPGRWDQPDYISVKVPPELTAVALSLRPGQRVRVFGWIETEDYMESLRQFLRRAGVAVPALADLDLDNVAVSRAATWIVADRIVPVPLNRPADVSQEVLEDRTAGAP
ncbi:MAG: hypothetical protein QN194_16465 [Armatimonadota bacterium]|nr:hypothetical protein [Armatimonadota bacterium]